MSKKNKIKNESSMVVIRPQKGKQELFLRSPADICIYGGAAGGGKTFAILLECLRHINNPRFEAVIFRQSRPQIMSAGGLFDTSQEIYPHLGATSVLTPNIQWRFQSGAKITFTHMFYEKEKYNWQGSQIPLLIFDELTHFTESQFFYLFSRNRSICGIRPYVRATCNPDGESWVAKFIDWWIDPKTGYADESKCGKLRYFLRRNNIIHWASTREELHEKFQLFTYEEQEDVKSLSFISAKLTDNQILMKHNPGYIGALRAMSEFDQEQLLNGNWKIRRAAGHYFKRSKVTMLDTIPTDIFRWVRAWDLAATTPSENDENEGFPHALRSNKCKDDSAYTAGVLLGKRKNGRVFVADVINVRENGADVRQLILNTARSDTALYGKVTIRLPQDPGQAGKDQAQSFVRMLGGYSVSVALESGNKVTRSEPFSSQWIAGNVDVREAEWNDDYFRQLENFPLGKLKDMVDASANAYLELENEKPEITLFKASSIQYFRIFEDSYQLLTSDGLLTYEKDKCQVFQTCDVASSLKTSVDYFVLASFALCPNGELLVLEVFRERLEGPDQPTLIMKKYQEYKPSLIGVESVNMGLTLYQQLRIMGLPIVELKPDIDKYTRAVPAAARYETGMIYHLEEANWLNDFETELLAFPNGINDDQVDVVSYAVYMQSWGYLKNKKKGSRVLVLG